jgi:hypothetical protein
MILTHFFLFLEEKEVGNGKNAPLEAYFFEE